MWLLRYQALRLFARLAYRPNHAISRRDPASVGSIPPPHTGSLCRWVSEAADGGSGEILDRGRVGGRCDRNDDDDV